MTVLRSENHIKIHTIYGVFIGSHRSLISVSISRALVESLTVCNVTSQKKIRDDYKLAKKPTPKPKPKSKSKSIIVTDYTY